MGQESMFWTTNTTGDGATTYPQERIVDWLRETFTPGKEASEGVVPGVGGQLAVSGSSSPISVATGAIYVYGRFLRSDAVVNLTVPAAVAGTTGHRVVARCNWATQEVRIVLLSAADGTATPPAVIQVAGTTWDISLATLTRSTGGAISITDTRDYAHACPALVYRRQGGSASDWTVAGTTIYTPGAQYWQMGSVDVTFSSSPSSNLVTVTFPVPYSAKPLVFPGTYNDGSSTERKCLFSIESVTNTQFQVRGYITDDSSTSNTITCYWHAIGER